MTLGEYTPGSIVRLGHDHIVLPHRPDGTTPVIRKEFETTMRFGNSKDWRESDIRRFLNGDYYEMMCAAVGRENIIPHTVLLEADDGTNKQVFCEDNISLLTSGLYRHYRQFLPRYGDWWWLANPFSMEPEYARNVCCVHSRGVLNWSDCGSECGVRPFCILNSSLLIE